MAKTLTGVYSFGIFSYLCFILLRTGDEEGISDAKGLLRRVGA